MLVTLRNFKNGCSLSNIREYPTPGFVSPYDYAYCAHALLSCSFLT